MTVRLLRPFNGFPTDAVVELDRGTEAALVSQRAATFNLAGGEVFRFNGALDSQPPIIGLSVAAEDFGVSPTATPTRNREAFQAALDTANVVTCYTEGVIGIDDLLFCASDKQILLGNNTTILGASAMGKALLKTSNVHWGENNFWMPGVMLGFVTNGTPAGIGQLRLSSNTLFYTAPGDTEGVGVAVTVGPASGTGTARYELPSGNPAWKLHCTVSQPSLGGTTFPLRIHNSTGSRPVTWSRTSNLTTVTETNHGRQANDVIILCGTNFIGQAFIQSVVDANTYTFVDTRSNSSGSGEVFGRRNISILGGTWDSNILTGTNSRGFEDRHALLCFGVTNLNVDCTIKNPLKYGLFTQGVANWNAKVVFSATNPASSTAAIQCDGHSFQGTISAQGRSTDTLTALIGGEFPAQGCWLLSTNEGGLNFTNTIVEDIYGDQCKFELVRLALAAGGVAKNTLIRHVRGSIDTTAQQMIAVGVVYDALLHNPGDYSLVDFIVEDVSVNKIGPNHLVQVSILPRGAVRSSGIKVRNVAFGYNNTASGDGFVIIGGPASGTCTIDDAEVTGVRHTTTSWQGRAVITQGTGLIRQLTVRDVQLVIDNALVNTTWISGCFTHEAAVTMDRCLVDECGMEDISAAGTKSDVWRCWTSGGAIDSLLITRMRCRGTLSLGEYNSTATATNIIMDDVDARSAATIFGIRVTRAATSVTVGNIRSYGTILTDLVRIGYSSFTMTVRSMGGLYTPSGGSGRHVNLAAGTANAPTCFGFDLWADETQLTTTRGQYVKSTAAGNPVVYRNATVWAEIA